MLFSKLQSTRYHARRHEVEVIPAWQNITAAIRGRIKRMQYLGFNQKPHLASLQTFSLTVRIPTQADHDSTAVLTLTRDEAIDAVNKLNEFIALSGTDAEFSKCLNSEKPIYPNDWTVLNE